MAKKYTGKQRRTFRTRNKLKRVNVHSNAARPVRPRLSVHRTNKQIYAQIIDDVKGVTLAAAASNDKELKLKSGATADAAREVGKKVAERAKKNGIESVQFDRGGFVYHGRVKALADAAREGGLTF